MEITIRSSLVSKKIELKRFITSLSSSCRLVLTNLENDYDVVKINNEDLFFISNTVIDEISKFSRYPEFGDITDILDIIGYSHDFLDREIISLSTTDKIYLNLFRNISRSCDLILFENIFDGLDNNNQKIMVKVIKYLLDKDYNFIISSESSDILYSLSDYSIVASDDEIIYSKTDEIYSDVDLLKRLNISIPTLSYITYKAKRDKGVKLFYSKDVRDIIKDIYKHV